METGICILAKHTICIHQRDSKMEFQAFHIDNSTPPGYRWCADLVRLETTNIGRQMTGEIVWLF